MADYSEEIATAIELLDEFGGLGSLRADTGTVPDPAKPWRVVDAEESATPVQVVVIEELSGATAYMPMGPLVTANVSPAKGMIVRDAGSAEWSIDDVAILNPDGLSPILATCRVSRWPTS